MLLLLLACGTPDLLTSTPASGQDTGETHLADTDTPTDTLPGDDTDSRGGGDDTGEDTGGPDTKEEPPPLTAADCFADQGLLVDYDQYGPTLGSHCKGTNHQTIAGVEHVVFVGDSITVGTPPTSAGDWYRNRLADALAADFGLASPSWLWENVDLLNGVVYEQDSGGFSSCAKWGARTDDITRAPHEQLQTCIPEDRRGEVTLVVMTVGGNDLFSWAQDQTAGTMSEAELWEAAAQAVADLEDSVHWLIDDPTRFPAGVYLVFANTFAFTDVDSASDFATCPGADLIGMDTGLVEPAFMAAAGWMMEEYMRIAVETGTDMVFLGEQSCGHGYTYDQSDGRCYRGADAELWLDVTCMHPSAAGHAGIADLFWSTISE
jgi:hypothetical protein